VGRQHGQLAGITQIVRLPDAGLIDAYETGFIYTRHLGLTIRTSGLQVTLTLTGQPPSGAGAVPAARVRGQRCARQRGDGRRADRHGHSGLFGSLGYRPAHAPRVGWVIQPGF